MITDSTVPSLMETNLMIPYNSDFWTMLSNNNDLYLVNMAANIFLLHTKMRQLPWQHNKPSGFNAFFMSS